MAIFSTYKIIENNLYVTSSFVSERTVTKSTLAINVSLSRTTSGFEKATTIENNISLKEYTINSTLLQDIRGVTTYGIVDKQKVIIQNPIDQAGGFLKYFESRWGQKEGAGYGDRISTNIIQNNEQGTIIHYTINGLQSIREAKFLTKEVVTKQNSTITSEILSKTYYQGTWSYDKIISTVATVTEIVNSVYYNAADENNDLSKSYVKYIDLNANKTISLGNIIKDNLVINTRNAILANYEIDFTPKKRFNIFLPQIIKNNEPITIWGEKFLNRFLVERTVISQNVSVPIPEAIQKTITLIDSFQYTDYSLSSKLKMKIFSIDYQPDQDYLQISTSKRLNTNICNLNQTLQEIPRVIQERTETILEQYSDLRTYTKKVGNIPDAKGFYDRNTSEIKIGCENNNLTWLNFSPGKRFKTTTGTLRYPKDYTVLTQETQINLQEFTSAETINITSKGNEIAEKTSLTRNLGDAVSYRIENLSIGFRQESGFILGFQGINIKNEFYEWVSLSIEPKIKITPRNLLPYIKPGIRTVRPIIDEKFTMTSNNKSIIGTINIEDGNVSLKWFTEINNKTTISLSTTSFKGGGTKFINTIRTQIEVPYMSMLRAAQGEGRGGNLANNALLSPTFFGRISNDNLTHYVIRNPFIFYDIINKKTVTVEQPVSFSYDSNIKANNNFIPYPFIHDAFASRTDFGRNRFFQERKIFGYINKWILDMLPFGTFNVEGIY
jgi:hypothetical protein